MRQGEQSLPLTARVTRLLATKRPINKQSSASCDGGEVPQSFCQSSIAHSALLLQRSSPLSVFFSTPCSVINYIKFNYNIFEVENKTKQIQIKIEIEIETIR